jgi:hypothetical protein
MSKVSFFRSLAIKKPLFLGLFKKSIIHAFQNKLCFTESMIFNQKKTLRCVKEKAKTETRPLHQQHMAIAE